MARCGHGVSLWGEAAQGWRAKTYTGYEVDWSVDEFGKCDAHALSCNFPVGLEPLACAHWPVWLMDMLPQGFGRADLLHLDHSLPDALAAKH